MSFRRQRITQMGRVSPNRQSNYAISKSPGPRLRNPTKIEHICSKTPKPFSMFRQSLEPTSIQDSNSLRKTIAERYGSRQDLRKVFIQWDQGGKGYLRPTDVYTMAQQMGLDVDLVSAKDLVRSFDSNWVGKMSLKDFRRMIYEHPSNITQRKQRDHGPMQTTTFRNHLPELRSKLQALDPTKSGNVSLGDFLFAINSLPLPKEFLQNDSLKQMYINAGGDAEGVIYETLLKGIGGQPRKLSLSPVKVSPILNINKLPFNIQEGILKKASKVRQALRKSFPDRTPLMKEISRHGQGISSTQLQALLDTLLQGSDITDTDISNFASQFNYNVDGRADVRDVCENINSLEHEILERASRPVRVLPPAPLRVPAIQDSRIVKSLLQALENKTAYPGKPVFDVFRSFDVDGDGYISAGDLKATLKRLGLKAGDEERQALISHFDSNSNGFISFSEFSQKLGGKKEAPSIQPDYHKTLDNHYRAKFVAEAHEKLRKSFQPTETPQKATRFGARPTGDSTFDNIIPPPTASAFANEVQRLGLPKNRTPISFSTEDKQRQMLKSSAKQTNLIYNIQSRNKSIEAQNQVALKRDAAKMSRKAEA